MPSSGSRHEHKTPAAVWPTAAQFTSFAARGVSLANVSTVPVAKAPEGVVYHAARPPLAALPDNVVRAQTIEEIEADGPQPTPPTPPAPPSESDLRETLQQCVRARAFADANLQRATEVAARATAHRAACEARLAAFADLDDRITDHTVGALRGGGRADLPDDLRRQLAERVIARDDLAAASRAQATLVDGMSEAQSEADAASKAANLAAATLSMVLAEQMAEAVVQHESEARRLRELAFGADMVGVHAPATLRSLFGTGDRFLKPVNRGPWHALRQRLLDDPACPLVLE